MRRAARRFGFRHTEVQSIDCHPLAAHADLGQPSIIRLGSGGLGTTYRLGAPTAHAQIIKLMPAGGLRARLSARLGQQIGNIAALSHHENMVTITGWGVRDDRWFVAFEEAPGGSLQRFVDAGLALEWQSVVRLGVQVATVLELAHDLGLLHRDVKPANILLSADGRPLLTDLGLGTLGCSFSLDSASAAASLAVAAPEAARTMALTPAADIFALAATLRLLLGARRGIASHRGDAPASLFDVLDEATSRDPRDRHPSIASLRADLELLTDRRWHRPLRFPQVQLGEGPGSGVSIRRVG